MYFLRVLLDSLVLITWMTENFAYKRGQQGKRKPLVVSNKIYDALLKLVLGKPLPPVKDRTRAEKTAVIHFWRANSNVQVKIENGTEVLYLGSRWLTRASEISNIVADKFHRMKGSGAKKLAHSLKKFYVGLSVRKVQNVLNNNQLHHQQNARFCKKAKLKPIHAKDVQIRHQIDLLDLGKKATVNQKSNSERPRP